MFRVIFLQNPNTKHIHKVFVFPNTLQNPKGYPIQHTWGLGTLYRVPPSTLSLAEDPFWTPVVRAGLSFETL